MKSLHTILVLGLVLGFASISSPGDSRDEESLHGFPVAKSARHLCDGQVYGTEGEEISWDALTSPEPPEKLAAFYTKRLGKERLTQDKDGWTWRMPAGSPQPDRVLSLDPVTADGPWTQCDKPIPSDARTVLLLSTMLRRSP
jgi:hypothetical protein